MKIHGHSLGIWLAVVCVAFDDRANQIVEHGHSIYDFVRDFAHVNFCKTWRAVVVCDDLSTAESNDTARIVLVVDIFERLVRDDKLDEMILQGEPAEVVHVLAPRTEGFVKWFV